jgi:hypothetical protein
MFLVQFERFRRGVLEVTRTLRLPSVDGAAALEYTQHLAGTRHWPGRTDALRVMDDHGRTRLDWRVPAPTPSPSTYLAVPVRAAFRDRAAPGASDGHKAAGREPLAGLDLVTRSTGGWVA